MRCLCGSGDAVIFFGQCLDCAIAHNEEQVGYNVALWALKDPDKARARVDRVLARKGK